MSDSDDWDSLINQSLGSKSGDVPNKMGPDSAILGTKESRFYAGYSEISPKSPESPIKKQGRGKSETVDTRRGGVVEQLNCDKNTDWVILVKASELGHECGKCDHLVMKEFARSKDRRTFHWRCAKGFDPLEAHYGGERLHIAAMDCDQYMDKLGAG